MIGRVAILLKLATATAVARPPTTPRRAVLGGAAGRRVRPKAVPAAVPTALPAGQWLIQEPQVQSLTLNEVSSLLSAFSLQEYLDQQAAETGQATSDENRALAEKGAARRRADEEKAATDGRSFFEKRNSGDDSPPAVAPPPPPPPKPPPHRRRRRR